MDHEGSPCEVLIEMLRVSFCLFTSPLFGAWENVKSRPFITDLVSPKPCKQSVLDLMMSALASLIQDWLLFKKKKRSRQFF